MQKHKILAFLLALIVSICLWFYAVTVVNPDDSTTINGISVQFEGLDALTARGLMLTGGDDTKVSVKMRARRSDLKELNNETVSATADVSRISASGEYQLTWNLVLPDTVATGDVSEISSIPSRISVQVSEVMKNADVPVKVEYTGELAESLTYQENTATLTPDALTVIGPSDEVATLNVPGLHNVSNALAAIALALDLKIPKEDILAGLSAFGGADRRCLLYTSISVRASSYA